jgi:hypothetical protein
METDLTWFDLAPQHGVLDLHERLTAGIGLELHIVVCSDDTTIAGGRNEEAVGLGVTVRPEGRLGRSDDADRR